MKYLLLKAVLHSGTKTLEGTDSFWEPQQNRARLRAELTAGPLYTVGRIWFSSGLHSKWQETLHMTAWVTFGPQQNMPQLYLTLYLNLTIYGPESCSIWPVCVLTLIMDLLMCLFER